MPTFSYTDGKKFTFEKFKPDAAYRVPVGQPPRSAGRYVGTVNVYVEQALFNFEREHRRHYRTVRDVKTIPFLDNPHIAVTCDPLAIGVPVGVYVPIRWNNYNNRFEIVLDGLENDDLILEDSLASEETKKKVYGIKTEDEEVAEIPVAAK